MMVDEDLHVALARLDGRLETLQQTVELRLHAAEEAAHQAREVAAAGQHRIDLEGHQLRSEFRTELDELRAVVEGLRRWQSKLLGVGVGISMTSGLVSGLIVLLLSTN